MAAVTARVPSVSVIVPVFNRRPSLRRLLDALAAQTHVDHEVIVVDDGSDDGSWAEAEADERAGRPVRVVRQPRAGAVAARRAGVALARADRLAFTDSDCSPEPGWLAAGVAALDAGAEVVNGVTHPAGPVGVLDHSVGSGDEGLYPTCNVFYRRDAYERAGGFDPAAAARLGFRAGSRARNLGFGEDTLLAWRVRRAGQAAFAPSAVVAHEVARLAPAEHLSRAWMAGAFPALVREVPELRQTLVRRRVRLGERSRLPVYLTALAVAARRPRLAAAGATWWGATAAVDAWRDPGPRSRRLLGAAVVVGKDAVTAAALVAGSVRARCLVL